MVELKEFSVENWEMFTGRKIVNDEGHRIERRIYEKIRRFKKLMLKRKYEYRLLEKLWNDPIITGLLLSDAHLRSIKDGQQSCFVLNVKERSKEIIDFVTEYLTDFGIGTCIDRQLHNGKYWSIRVTSYRNFVFTELRKRWYPENKKIVPYDVKLTDKCVAFWFMGDGTSYWRKQSMKKVHVTFCTDGFKKEDVILLKKLLIDNFELKGVYMRELHSPRKGNRLELELSNDVEKLMYLMEPFMLKIYSYKIKIPIVRTRKQAIECRRKEHDLIRNEKGQIITWKEKYGNN